MSSAKIVTLNKDLSKELNKASARRHRSANENVFYTGEKESSFFSNTMKAAAVLGPVTIAYLVTRDKPQTKFDRSRKNI